MTKSLLLIIFSTVLSVNIAFSKEDIYLPMSMTIEEFVNNCGALVNGKVSSRKEEIDSSYCMGIIWGIYLSEGYGHVNIPKWLDLNRTSYKPLLCFDDNGMSFKHFLKFMNDTVSILDTQYPKNPKDLKAVFATYQAAFKARVCADLEKTSKEDHQDTDSSDSDFKDVLFEINSITSVSKFKDALEAIKTDNYEKLSQDEMYKVIYVKGAINSVNVSFSKEKNSKCAFIPAREFSDYLLNLLNRDDGKGNMLKKVPLTDILHLTISLMYKNNCKDDTGGSYDMPKDENELMAGGFVIGKYYANVTIGLFKKVKEMGFAKQFNEGLIKESKFLDTLPKKTQKRIVFESYKKITNQIANDGLSESKKAIFFGRLGALANLRCNLDPDPSKCYKP